MRSSVGVAVLLVALAGAIAVPHVAAAPPAAVNGVTVRAVGGGYAVTNGDGTWTIRTHCRTSSRRTVGPGYVSGLVAASGERLVDDFRGHGTLNDPLFGGLGAFGWHHARGRPGSLRFHGKNAWEVSGRVCARANGGFGVSGSGVSERPRVVGEGVEFAVDVLFSDAQTYPRALLHVRYRYRFERSVVRSWIEVTSLCDRGRCGRTRQIAFVKEPKVVAHVTGGDYTRLTTWSDAGQLQCLYTGAGNPTGAILSTGQCAADGRSRLRFDYGTATSGGDGACEGRACLNIVMRAYEAEVPGERTLPWAGAGHGLDAWAVASGGRPAAHRRDTASVDGVVWNCHGANPARTGLRRWETHARRDRSGRTIATGGLFPAWEGGRGGYDCEPLARAFGPAGETYRLFASYSVGDGWEALR